MSVIYRWKPGAQVKVDAQTAGEELERIRVSKNGRLESGDVVEEAKDEQSPLHPVFEWDDAVAADAFRVEQAKYLIRSVEVVIQKTPTQKAPVRAFVSVVRDTDRSYTSVSHALSDVDLRNQVIAQAWRELEAWRQRHAELIEFATLFAAIDQARPAA